MSIRFYFDHNVDRAITDGLRRRGIDVLTAYEDGHHQVDDSILIDRATKLGRVAVSFDRDFVVEARRRQHDGSPFRGVIYAAQSMPVGACIDQLELIATASEPDELENALVFLPLR